MELTIHVYLHPGPLGSSADQKLDAIFRAVAALAAKETSMNADVSAKLDDLRQKVAAETAVNQGAVTLLNGLSAQIAALRSTTTDPTVLAAIDDLAAGVSQQTADLAAAVIANTPAAM